MASSSDDARQLRNRNWQDRGGIENAPPNVSDVFVCDLLRPVSEGGKYPATAQAVYPCRPCSLQADEVSGGTVTITVQTDCYVYATNVGSAIPTADSVYVIGHHINGEIVFRYDG